MSTNQSSRVLDGDVVVTLKPAPWTTKARVPADKKVLIHFRAAGDAPILNQSKFKVSASHTFAVVAEFLRKQLRYKQKDRLFLFCNASFSPNPDELVNDLYECFKINDALVVNYATTPAWG